MLMLRRYLASLLVAALVLTGHSAVAARGMTDATGQMVLCTGSGPVTVYVDEHGQPTKPPHYCPECMLHLIDLVEPGSQLCRLHQTGGVPLAAAPDGRSLVSYKPLLTAPARAPPVTV
ncbi:MAG: hypothetical protein MRY77_14135 [Rhodobacteraceae bacterium]|jgi:hypothetical protein|nr:hypothetical protein [Paracoccaceae bacterium]